MEIFLDNIKQDLEKVNVNEKSTLEEISQKVSIHPSRLAMLVNGNLVPRQMWGDTLLTPLDKLEIITLVAGG